MICYVGTSKASAKYSQRNFLKRLMSYQGLDKTNKHIQTRCVYQDDFLHHVTQLGCPTTISPRASAQYYSTAIQPTIPFVCL